MLSGFGINEILLIAILILLFFGGRKLPEFIKGIGQAFSEFRKAVKE